MNHSPEPWAVRLYSTEPAVCMSSDGKEAWVYQSWDIISSDSERRVAEVGFRTDAGPWSPVSSPVTAKANRDRIVACVNACAGITDPLGVIPQLVAQKLEPTMVTKGRFPGLKLLPCPFCGSEEVHMEEMIPHWFVECANCGVRGPWSSTNEGSAVCLWNKRDPSLFSPSEAQP